VRLPELGSRLAVGENGLVSLFFFFFLPSPVILTVSANIVPASRKWGTKSIGCPTVLH
jgi:hypothetical protein